MDAAKKMPKAIILFPVFIPAVVVTLLLVIGTIRAILRHHGLEPAF